MAKTKSLRQAFDRRAFLQFTAAVLAAIFFVGPILWMIATAFKRPLQAFTGTPTWFFQPTLQNFRTVLEGGAFTGYIWHSIIVASASTVLALILGSGIAYPLARVWVPAKRHLALWILSLRMIPLIAVIVPVFILFSGIGLTGTLWSLILLYTYMNLPLTVWILRSFFADMPVEIEEAAQIDGANGLRMFAQITVPLAAPGIVATGLLAFIFAWNEFLFANILASTDNKTAPLGLAEYVTPVGIAWTEIMAAGILVAIPVWIAALATQRYLVRGLSMGAVK